MIRPRFKNLFDIQKKKGQRVQKTYIYKCPREKKDQKKSLHWYYGGNSTRKMNNYASKKKEHFSWCLGFLRMKLRFLPNSRNLQNHVFERLKVKIKV